MVPITFSKTKSEHFLAHLGTDRGDVARPEDDWTADNLIMLAGAALASLTTRDRRCELDQGLNLDTISEIQSASEGCLEIIDEILDDTREVESDSQFEGAQLRFSRSRASYILKRLGTDRGDVARPEDDWTAENLVLLAAAALAIVTTHGPRLELAQGLNLDQVSPEQREAIESRVVPDNILAIQWVTSRCLEILEGAYDARFEEVHRLLLQEDEPGHLSVKPVAGFKVIDRCDPA